jgi:hypothetical protein
VRNEKNGNPIGRCHEYFIICFKYFKKNVTIDTIKFDLKNKSEIREDGSVKDNPGKQHRDIK